MNKNQKIALYALVFLTYTACLYIAIERISYDNFVYGLASWTGGVAFMFLLQRWLDRNE